MAVGYDRNALNYGLILDLRQREGTGTVTRDWSDFHYAMAWAGTPTWASETGGPSSLSYDGTGDYLYLAASADFDFTTEDMSMCAWLYPTDAGSARAVFARGLVDTCGWEWYFYTSNFAFRTNQAGSRCGSAALNIVTLNEWNFYAFVRRGLTGRFYVNGYPVPSYESAGGLLDPVACGAAWLYVGSNSHDNFYEGKMWHPRIWNRRLTDGEVLNIWRAERELWDL